MTTDNGIPRPGAIAQWIDTIRDRRDWLASRVEHGESNSYVESELAALEWALPVLDAEHGAMIRLFRDIVAPAERLVSHLTERDQLAQFGRHEFEGGDDEAHLPLVRQHCVTCGVQFARHAGATRPDHMMGRA